MSLTFGSASVLGSLDGAVLAECAEYAEGFVVHYDVRPPKRPSLHIYEDSDHISLLLGTVYEAAGDNPAEHVFRRFREKGAEAVQAVDGCFLFAVRNKRDAAYTVFTERFGVIPLYYTQRDGEILFSTSMPLLFSDFTPDDFDPAAVRDLLRHGTLIGEATLSARVRMIEGGTSLVFRDGTVSTQRLFLFRYDEDNAERDLDRLADEVAETYTEAVRKRMGPVLDDACILLSGGLDSRFLLSTLNRLSPGRVACVTMGQPFSEETAIAARTAGLKGNPHHIHELRPGDFLSRADEFIRLTCGSDVFFQSFSLDVANSVPFSTFATGFSLDALIGGTFLNEIGMRTAAPLSTFFRENERAFKMQLFSEEEFDWLCGEKRRTLPRESEHLGKALQEYDRWSVQDVMQPFGVRTRAMRLVLGRELVFCASMDEGYPSVDRDFLAAIARIPAHARLNHSFYRSMLLRVCPEYCDIPYNNTNLPVGAPLGEWKKGAAREAEREKVYAAMQLQSLGRRDAGAPYYPHYYSDFAGCSRMDPGWRNLMSAMLLPDARIARRWFDQDRIEQLLREHLSGHRDHRSKLVYLTSLEMFLRQVEGRTL